MSKLLSRLEQHYSDQQQIDEFDPNTVDPFHLEEEQAKIRTLREKTASFTVDLAEHVKQTCKMNTDEAKSFFRQLVRLLVENSDTTLLLTLCNVERRDEVRKFIVSTIEETQLRMFNIRQSEDLTTNITTLLRPIAEPMTTDEIKQHLDKALIEHFDSFVEQICTEDKGDFQNITAKSKNKTGMTVFVQITPQPSSVDYSAIYNAKESPNAAPSETLVQRYKIFNFHQTDLQLQFRRFVVNVNADEMFIIVYRGDSWQFCESIGRLGKYTALNPLRANNSLNEAYSALTAGSQPLVEFKSLAPEYSVPVGMNAAMDAIMTAAATAAKEDKDFVHADVIRETFIQEILKTTDNSPEIRIPQVCYQAQQFMRAIHEQTIYIRDTKKILTTIKEILNTFVHINAEFYQL